MNSVHLFNLILFSCVVFLLSCVKARSIHQQKVSITILNMEQYRTTVEHSQKVWIIQICDPNKASEAFKKAAYVLRGVARAGIIDCLNEENCNEFDQNKITTGKIIFIHSEGVENDFINNHDFNHIVESTLKLINEKVKIQKDSIQHYNPDKVQIIEFSSDNF